MRKLKLIKCAVCLLIFCTACSQESSVSHTQTSNSQDPDLAFQSLVDDYLNKYWQLHPNSALYAGLYEYDNQLSIPDANSRAHQNQLSQSMLQQLMEVDATALNDSNKTDRLILINRLQYGQWNEEVLQSWKWDPSNYNVAGAFGLILNTDYKPLPQRLDTFYQRMENVPAYYQAAQANITQPTQPHLELAIQQNRGALNLFEERFLKIAQDNVPQETLELYWQRVDSTVAAIKNHIDYLEKLNAKLQEENGFRSFRLGAALFSEKFHRQIATDFSANQVYELALDKKQALHNEMAEITTSLWPKYFPEMPMPGDRLEAIDQMIGEVAKTHGKKEDFVDEVRQQIADLETFVREHDLLDLDPSKPLVVREMPEYERGFAVASVDAPGPFAAEANTYFNVSPLDDYDDASAESFLREYNNRTMQILNIHEAIPGHYAQLVHSNKSKSLVKSLFGNGAMVEGWAVYAEHMMMEAGYGNNEPELRLMYDKWLIRSVINAIIDHDIHCNNMSEDQALAMLRHEGFQEEAEATGKWRRATLSQVQLSSYFTGYSEILAFRNELKEALGDKFNLKDFHHQFLSYGSAPVPIIKQLMRDSYLSSHK